MRKYALVPVERLAQLEEERKRICNSLPAVYIATPITYIIANRRWHTIKLPDFLIKLLGKL